MFMLISIGVVFCSLFSSWCGGTSILKSIFLIVCGAGFWNMAVFEIVGGDAKPGNKKDWLVSVICEPAGIESVLVPAPVPDWFVFNDNGWFRSLVVIIIVTNKILLFSVLSI